MATKVGAFKKDGTVQCVKLVEEPKESLKYFIGHLNKSKAEVDFDNGIKLTFLRGTSIETATVISSLPTNSWSIEWNCDTSDTGSSISDSYSFYTRGFSSTNFDGHSWLSGTNEDNFYVSGPLYVTSIQFQNIGADYLTSDCFVKLSYKNVVYNYKYNLTSGPSVFVTPISDRFPIEYSARIYSPTVRMCKNGTLKCAKLIEEEYDTTEQNRTVSNFEGTYSCTVSGSVYTSEYKLNCGMTITITGSKECPSVHLISPYSVRYMVLSKKNENEIGVLVEAAYSSTTSVTIPIIYVTASSSSDFTSATIQYQGMTYTGPFSFVISGSSNYFRLSSPVPFPLSLRFKPPTVRVYKDGTIRCAKLQEATVTKKFEEQPSKDANYSRFVFSNGYVLEAKNANSNALVPVETNSLWGYDLYHKDSSGNLTPLMFLINGDTRDDPVWTYTVYDEFYDPQYSINWCDCNSPLMGVTGTYLILYNAQGESVGQLDSTAYTPGVSMHTAYSGGPFEIPMSDRISYSWDN